MNPEVKQLWVDALRSGDYKQGNGGLHYSFNGEERFCCLGVLCDVAVKAGRPVNVHRASLGTVSYDGASGYLPASVREWAGVDTSNPSVGGYTLADLNDGDGRDFAYIADQIEEYL